eukprot:11051969-Ditylum_brightwellii.AAC.1
MNFIHGYVNTENKRYVSKQTILGIIVAPDGSWNDEFGYRQQQGKPFTKILHKIPLEYDEEGKAEKVVWDIKIASSVTIAHFSRKQTK